MKKLMVALAILAGFGSCTKAFVQNEDLDKFKDNVDEIRSLNDAQNLGLTENVNLGIFWKKTKESPASGVATQDLAIHIAFTLKTLDGQILFQELATDSLFFDAGTAATTYTGLLFAVGELREGEKGVFYLPAAAAYGANPPAGVALQPYQVTVLEMESIKFYDELDLIDLYIQRQGLTDPEVTSTGLRIVRVEEGTSSDSLVSGDRVTVKYKGYFLNGDVFDEGELSVIIGTSSLIEGFAEGISNMKVGEKTTVIIPWELGYGSSGNSSIPPFTTLGFDIEIVSKDN